MTRNFQTIALYTENARKPFTRPGAQERRAETSRRTATQTRTRRWGGL